MKIYCKCGNVLTDSTDDLSYKGSILADQDMNTFWEIIDKLEKPHKGHISAFSEINGMLRRNMYQCTECGRLFVEDQANNYKLVRYEPEITEQDDSKINKNLLISTFGEKWKGYLIADWYDDKPDWVESHGVIMPVINIELDNLCFDDFEPFKKRFFEVLEFMKARDIVTYALLKINGKHTYQWPEK